MHLKCALTFCFIVLLTLHVVDSYKILAVYPFPWKSHFMMTNTLIEELIRQGHEITMITGISLAHLKLGSNYTEILVDQPYNLLQAVKEIFKTDSYLDLTSDSIVTYLKLAHTAGLVSTEHALKQPNVQAIINAKQTDGVYDLLLVQQFYQEAFLALAYKYNIPTISTCTMGFENYMSKMVGIIIPWSFVPHRLLPLSGHMTFVTRIKNTYYNLYEEYIREFSYFPKMDKLVEKYFSQQPAKIPKVTQMQKNLALILVNGYRPMTTVQPTSDSIIPVGGLHIAPVKPLPSDIQTYLDGASKHGAVFFSLGSTIQSKDMTPEKLKIFLTVFAGLKQRILWKYEDENIANLPPNVMVKKWLPQNDILAHPNLRLFMTHGGLFSIQEGTYHGIPMLGMPFFGDQRNNLKRVQMAGYGIHLDFSSMTQRCLHKGIVEILNNTTYRENAQRISKIFRDRPMEARKTAIYWIEYVMRHKGAPHLRSAGLDLEWYQFYLLDVIGFIICCALFVIIVFAIVVRKAFKFIAGERKMHQITKQKQG